MIKRRTVSETRILRAFFTELSNHALAHSKRAVSQNLSRSLRSLAYYNQGPGLFVRYVVFHVAMVVFSHI